MTLDVTQFAAEAAEQEQGYTFEVEDAAGRIYLRADGKPQTITVLGSYAPVVRRAMDANLDRSIRGKMTAASLMAGRIRVAQAAITGWTLELGGQPVPLTPENVATLMRAALWILEQVEAGMRGDRDFSRRASENS